MRPLPIIGQTCAILCVDYPAKRARRSLGSFVACVVDCLPSAAGAALALWVATVICVGELRFRYTS